MNSSDEGSDEDEDDGGWLAHKFDNPPVSHRSQSAERRPLDPGDAFAVSRFKGILTQDVILKTIQDTFTPNIPLSSPSRSTGFEDSFTIDVS